MALSALSGCVTVQRPPVPGPPAAVPSPPSAPRPGADAEPQVVQAPAREALEMVGPARERAATTLRQRHRPAPSAVPDGHAPAYRAHPQHPRPRPAHPDPRRRVPRHVDVPDVETEIRRNTDVCALGRKYGGWRDDSPEALACRQVYGHR
ncbi:hypothetical protein AQJ64_11795 [Streptomyces griseoruber]|uniref:Uncharacterized protein n=3 Tax=Streptomyces griseoruber TaxID=1943 RepID=A0A101T4G9_9ACTN|nr:hypothetical protein AQJ64_11795 [Streptomyces griseoruber]